MLPAFLITFRESIEAALIISLIMGMAVSLREENKINIIIGGVVSALLCTVAVSAITTNIGYSLEKILNGNNEILYDGLIQIGSGIFILWTIFSLHKYFIISKAHLVKKIKQTLVGHEERNLFMLVFILIFKEGLEVALFLSAVYLTASPADVIIGMVWAILATIILGLIVYKTETKIPVRYAFKITSAILIVISAFFIIKGLMEISEVFL